MPLPAATSAKVCCHPEAPARLARSPYRSRAPPVSPRLLPHYCRHPTGHRAGSYGQPNTRPGSPDSASHQAPLPPSRGRSRSPWRHSLTRIVRPGEGYPQRPSTTAECELLRAVATCRQAGAVVHQPDPHRRRWIQAGRQVHPSPTGDAVGTNRRYLLRRPPPYWPGLMSAAPLIKTAFISAPLGFASPAPASATPVSTPPRRSSAASPCWCRPS